MSPSTLWVRIRNIGDAAFRQSIIERELQFGPHLFRRTFATLYYRETRDIKATQMATRHASVETLVRHYVDSGCPTKAVADRFLSIKASDSVNGTISIEEVNE